MGVTHFENTTQNFESLNPAQTAVGGGGGETTSKKAARTQLRHARNAG